MKECGNCRHSAQQTIRARKRIRRYSGIYMWVCTLILICKFDSIVDNLTRRSSKVRKVLAGASGRTQRNCVYASVYGVHVFDQQIDKIDLLTALVCKWSNQVCVRITKLSAQESISYRATMLRFSTRAGRLSVQRPTHRRVRADFIYVQGLVHFCNIIMNGCGK